MVPVRKQSQPNQPSGAVRVRGDYSVFINGQLETYRKLMPLPEDLMRRLDGTHYFSKVDLADAYNQIKLEPQSQRRIALSTHRGVLLQTRLPFGISSATGYFQDVMNQLTSDLPGVAVYPIIGWHSVQTGVCDPALYIMGHFLMFPVLWKTIFWNNYA